jgi:hypothetical protein
MYRYTYFAGSTLASTTVNSNYIVTSSNTDLIGWADEECSKSYAYVCEYTGRFHS